MATGPTPDLAGLRQEIRACHDAFIGAHVRNQPGFLIQDLSEDYVNVSRGEFLRQTKEEILEMLVDYLGHTTLSEYRLLTEPTTGFSNDGSVAWSIFRPKVAGAREMPDAKAISFDSTRGCLVLFERRGDRRVRIAEASNRKLS